MDPLRPGQLRIFQEPPSEGVGSDPRELARRELLRPPSERVGQRELEPFSRGWFEELEFKRYSGPGEWLRRVLEFSRHPGESLIMFGAGVGSDAVQYQRHGAQVTVCAAPSDQPEVVRRNFESRGLSVRMVAAGPDLTAPFGDWTFDLAYINAVFVAADDFHRLVSEAYRVLKPGGKVFALLPAHYDARYWQRIWLPLQRWYGGAASLTDCPGQSARSLKRAFAGFEDCRVAKRHVRRGDLPHLWRFLPRTVLERLVGQVLVLRAFKPVAVALRSAAA